MNEKTNKQSKTQIHFGKCHKRYADMENNVGREKVVRKDVSVFQLRYEELDKKESDI